MKPVFIKAPDAIKALPARGPIHCFAGFIGADWNKKEVIRELKRAKKIAWTDNLVSHNLTVLAGPESHWHGRGVLYFDVRKPERI